LLNHSGDVAVSIVMSQYRPGSNNSQANV